MEGPYHEGERDGHRGKENERFSNKRKWKGLTTKEKEIATEEKKMRGSQINENGRDLLRRRKREPQRKRK